MVDHYAEAERILKNTVDFSEGMAEKGPFNLAEIEGIRHYVNAGIASAQVHATLALVDAQRTATRVAGIRG